jgi:YidC/Oxa1 family membrane protein insertase
MSYPSLLSRREGTLASAGVSLGVLNVLFVGVAVVFAAVYSWVGSYATTIIVLGAGFTVLATPLVAATWRSQVARSRLTPKLDELNTEFSGDRQRLVSETQALFHEHGVSAWAGCLPALVVAPVSLALYQVIRGLTYRPAGSMFFSPRDLSHSSRLFHALGSSTRVQAWGVNLANNGITALHLSAASTGLFLGLVAVTLVAGIWQQHLIRTALPPPRTSNPAAAQRLAALLPALVAVWGFVLPLAVTLYYASSSVVRLLQQWILIKLHPF